MGNNAPIATTMRAGTPVSAYGSSI
jgi:hypothetical protein